MPDVSTGVPEGAGAARQRPVRQPNVSRLGPFSPKDVDGGPVAGKWPRNNAPGGRWAGP
ncbi:hypothetical protein JCM13580A_01760 [Streptomyces drozdowiczii]